jgi:hypothetical protein
MSEKILNPRKIQFKSTFYDIFILTDFKSRKNRIQIYFIRCSESSEIFNHANIEFKSSFYYKPDLNSIFRGFKICMDMTDHEKKIYFRFFLDLKSLMIRKVI